MNEHVYASVSTSTTNQAYMGFAQSTRATDESAALAKGARLSRFKFLLGAAPASAVASPAGGNDDICPAVVQHHHVVTCGHRGSERHDPVIIPEFCAQTVPGIDRRADASADGAESR